MLGFCDKKSNFMKNNLIPSIVIASAIVISAVFSHWAEKRAAENFINSLKEGITKKEASGKTQIEEMSESIVASVVKGFKAGFSLIGDSSDLVKKEVKLPSEHILLKEVTVVRGGQESRERVIGVVKNNSASIVKRIQANVVFRNSKGELIDVQSGAQLLDGFSDATLNPGQELGFEIERSWGIADEDDALESKVVADAQITITEVRGENEADAEIKNEHGAPTTIVAGDDTSQTQSRIK